VLAWVLAKDVAWVRASVSGSVQATVLESAVTWGLPLAEVKDVSWAVASVLGWGEEWEPALGYAWEPVLVGALVSAKEAVWYQLEYRQRVQMSLVDPPGLVSVLAVQRGDSLAVLSVFWLAASSAGLTVELLVAPLGAVSVAPRVAW
jgi:hypothetical protein